MSSYGQVHDEHDPEYIRLRVKYNLDGCMRDAATVIQKLRNSTENMPRPGEDGFKDAPFQGMLETQKKAAILRAQEIQATLKRFLPAVDKEVARCRANLGRVSHDATILITPGAKTKYRESIFDLEKQYETAVRQRKDLIETIEYLTSDLEKARSHRTPSRPAIPQSPRRDP